MATRNPKWTREELVLALALYATNPKSPPGKSSLAVQRLSEDLRRLAAIRGMAGDFRFRNPNGVYLKLMNFRAFDPNFTSEGKVGMTGGGAQDRAIWDEFSGRWDELAREAAAIRSLLADAPPQDALPTDQEDPYEAEEGRANLRLHKRYERDRLLIEAKKKEARRLGKLECEACSFDFAATYGQLGSDFIEVHHTRPVSTMAPGDKTQLKDLALLCSNCHRMAHRRRDPLSVAELRAALRR